MRARNNPKLFDRSLLVSRKEFTEQHVCTVLGEVESNLRFMCLAMDAARFNVFNGDADEPTLENALGLLEAFYIFVDGQADVLLGVLQEMPLFTMDELREIAANREAQRRAPAARPRPKMGFNAAEMLKSVRPVEDFNDVIGETVAPENAG